MRSSSVVNHRDGQRATAERQRVPVVGVDEGSAEFVIDLETNDGVFILSVLHALRHIDTGIAVANRGAANNGGVANGRVMPSFRIGQMVGSSWTIHGGGHADGVHKMTCNPASARTSTARSSQPTPTDHDSAVF